MKKTWISFGLIFLFSLLFKFGAGLHFSLLAPLGEQILPIWIVGMIISAASLLQMIFDVPAGMLLDKFGYVRLLRIFSFIFVLAAAVFLFGLSPITFIISIILATFGWLFYGPGVNAYVLAEVPHAHAGKIMGILHAFESGGIVLSSILLPFVITKSSETVGFIIGGIILVSLILLFFVKPERSLVHKEVTVRHHHYYVRRQYIHKVLGALKRLNPASSMLIVQSFTGSLFYGAIWFAIPLAIAQGMASDLPSIGLGVFDFAVVVLGALFGTLADKFHKGKLVLTGLFIFAAASMLLGFNFNIWFLFLGFIATAGDELAYVSLWTWLEHLDADHSEDGLVNGAITLFEDLGWAVGPLLAGILFSLIGPSGVIMVGALILFAAWIVSLFLLRRYDLQHVAHRTGSIHGPYRKRHKR